MARLRTLKPGFFSNEKLAEIPPLGRLLFQGLWCLADRAGRLEDRPRKIKAGVLPYDEADVDALLEALAERGFIVRYAVDGARYIQVVTFGKHQNPHVKEAASTIPAPPDQQQSIGQAPGKHSAEHNLGDGEHARTIGIRTIGDLGVGSGEWEPEPGRARAPEAPTAAATSPPIPAALRSFDATLARWPGYEPGPEFYATVVGKFGHLDLDVEAIKLASWLKDHPGKPCSSRRVLNWLERAAAANRGRDDAASRNGAGGHDAGSAGGGRSRRAPPVGADPFAGYSRSSDPDD